MSKSPAKLKLIKDDQPEDLSASQSPESMTSRAYTILKHDIISGKLKAGSKLKIEELRRQYDAGTSPIREALSLLTSDHLVERIDQRGFRVSSVSETEFAELLKTRCWLEAVALRESIQNGSQTWEESVVLANYRLSRIPRSQSSEVFIDNSEWETAHKHFHMTLLAECGSSMMRKFCDQLYDQNIRYRQLSGKSAYPSRDIAAEHNAIADAVLARDADKAVRLLVNHYQKTSGFLAQQLAED
ncbi:GntR family transcriptional regulator [Pseudahrensia aquimaris]|uniref:GntR family transcriptional regulator n=1 Tax=Pseudahrensia aquimaris TaxID=744461 RepID=A0ABW3F8S8_9HYPH